MLVHNSVNLSPLGRTRPIILWGTIHSAESRRYGDVTIAQVLSSAVAG